MAVVDGKPLSEMPSSLYVPPSAMRVLLENFEGPLDLLYHLIRKENMDILDIPMAELTRQYLAYVDQIVDTEMELVADYLLMSATLIEIKSRMLLPQPEEEEQEEEDPRAALVQRLLEYSRIKGASESLKGRGFVGRDTFLASVARPEMGVVKPRIGVRPLHLAMLAVLDRKRMSAGLEYSVDEYTVREAMAHVMLCFRSASEWLLTGMVGASKATRSRLGTFFVASLQLAKDQVVRLRQKDESDLVVELRDDDRR